MNIKTYLLATTLCALWLGSNATPLSAAEQKDFTNVVPFMSPVGRLGFFDQKTGMIYLYDSELKTCTFTGKLSELGQAIEKEVKPKTLEQK